MAPGEEAHHGDDNGEGEPLIERHLAPSACVRFSDIG